MSTSPTPPLQLNLQPRFFTAEEQELLSQPSILWATGSSAQAQPNWFELANVSTLPDDYGLTHLAFPMAAKVDQFAKAASSRGFIGAKVRDEGGQTYFQLQQSSKNAQEKEASYQLQRSQERRDTQQLKTTISESSLKKRTSFAERKQSTCPAKLLGEKKEALKKCVMMSDDSGFGAAFCIEKYVSEVPDEQKKELLAEVPKAFVVKGVNALAAPFAAVSIVTKTAFKGMYLSGVSQGCIDNDPHNYEACMKRTRDVLEGRNPEVNQAIKEAMQPVKEAMPQWLLDTGGWVVEKNAQLHQFDQFMHKEYGTIQGIIHEAAGGVMDVTLALATGPAVQLVKGVTKGVANGLVNTTKAVSKASETLYKKIEKIRVSPVGTSRLEGVAVKTFKGTLQKFEDAADLYLMYLKNLSRNLQGNILQTAPALASRTAVNFTKNEGGNFHLPQNSSIIFQDKNPPRIILSSAEDTAISKNPVYSSRKAKERAERKERLKDRKRAETLAEGLVEDNQKTAALNSTIARNDKISKMRKEELEVLQNVPAIQNIPVYFSEPQLNFIAKFVQRERFLFQEIGKDILFFFPLTMNKKFRLKECVEAAFVFAERNNKNRVFMAWDPNSRALALYVNRQKTIIGVGEISRGKDILPLKVIETGIGVQRSEVTRLAESITQDLAKTQPASVASNQALISTSAKVPASSAKSTLRRFFKDEFGGGKLPIERDFIIELIEKIGYKKVPGGKGSHEKWRKPNCKMITIPQGVNGELPRGTVGSIMRSYDDAIKSEMVSQSQSLTIQTPKVNQYAYTKPFPHRIDYASDYLQSTTDFIVPKEFNGVLKRDLFVVQYHSSAPLGTERTYKWFMPVCQGNKLCTIEEVQNAVAKLSSYGEINHVALAKIPAGEAVRFLHGRAIEKFDQLAQTMRSGGGVQYRFFDFDPNWIVKTGELK